MIKKFYFLLIFLNLAMLSFAQGQSEQLTITTYYPSPYGVYKTLRIFPYNAAPPTCDDNNSGTYYFSGTYSSSYIISNRMYYCDGARWRSLGVQHSLSSSTPCGNSWVIADTGISHTTYPNASVSLRGANAWDNNRKFRVELVKSETEPTCPVSNWCVKVGPECKGDGSSQNTIYWQLLYWQ